MQAKNSLKILIKALKITEILIQTPTLSEGIREIILEKCLHAL